MIDQHQQNNPTNNFVSPEFTSTTNYKPYIYTVILAIIAVGGLGYYLMPEKVVYEPISGLDNVPKESDTPISTQPVTSQNPNVVVTPAPTPAPVACTEEAMMCPDGSYVGRSGPNCQFVCASTGFIYNQFPAFEVIFPAEYKEIANQVKSYSGVDEKVVLYNTGDISVIPRVAEMTIILGDYVVPEGPYSKFHTINVNGRAFNVYDTQCRGDIFGCQLTRMTTRLSKHTIIFDVAFHTGEGSPASLAEQEAHISRIKINEK